MKTEYEIYCDMLKKEADEALYEDCNPSAIVSEHYSPSKSSASSAFGETVKGIKSINWDKNITDFISMNDEECNLKIKQALIPTVEQLHHELKKGFE